MKGFNLQFFLVKAMRSVVDSARVGHRDTALGMARNLHRCMWALASVWCPDGVQARAGKTYLTILQKEKLMPCGAMLLNTVARTMCHQKIS